MSCRLCDAQNHKALKDKVYNRRLFETQHFVIIPALGPLVVGHVMVVSRCHIPSLLSAGSRIRNDYDHLMALLRTIPPYRDNDLLEAEHGALSGNSGGACIEHAHVNIFPKLGRYSAMFDGTYPIAGSSDAFPKRAPDFPYVLLRGSSGFRIYDATSAGSQAIRRGLCGLLGLPDWDWRVEPNLELIEQTVALWSSSQ